MGTPGFAAATLERLYREGYYIAGVFTQPDKPRNRGMKVSFSAVKELAISNGTPVYQPALLKNGEADDIVRELECELIVVVAYGNLLPRDLLSIPTFGCVNLHGSLLPKYRGAAPVQWAVLNGERETGVSTMRMAEELDTGDVFMSKKTEIGEDETMGELYGRLCVIGSDLLCDTIAAISAGTATCTPQDHREATYAPSLRKNMSPIDWAQSALSIKNKVRGLNPWPVATAEFGGLVYKVFAVDISGEIAKGRNPGDIIETGKNGLEVACADGTVLIKELQAPGGKRMAAADYLRGHRIV